jgi:hypothetical protein
MIGGEQMGYDVHLGGTRGGGREGGIGIVSHVMGSRAKVSVSWGCSSEPRKDNANGEFATIIMLLEFEEKRGWLKTLVGSDTSCHIRGNPRTRAWRPHRYRS